MTREEANTVLDLHRAGHDIAPEIVDAALRATGDLEAA